MIKKIYIFFALITPILSLAQDNSSNPLYWKNRKPYDGYWQQDVAYKIKATIDDKNDIILGNDFELIYTNNSPDTLKELYFHLFSNAFQPNSYYHQLWKGNDREPFFGTKYEMEGKGTEVNNIKVNGKQVQSILDNTILKVILVEPILPNTNTSITLDFKTYYDTGEMRRRMKMYQDNWGNKHFDGVHWYPSIAVYDQKFGWTTDQHLDKEFYHDFGTFEVELTFPQHYIVEATGVLQNEEDVLPKELREKLDIKNFKDKPFNSPPSQIIPIDSNKYKTWKYKSENTHNFVFTADPTYRIGVVEWNGIKCISLPQEPHAAKWQESGAFLAEVIKIYSTDFGMYEWPKIIIADANDGMEYSMITLDGGTYPGHQSLIAHEVGHMWFYGQVDSNETYRANMDEGFTQFLTTWFMDKFQKPRIPADKYTTFGAPYNRFFSLYYPYLSTVWSNFDHPLNTHAADYNSGIRHEGGYGLVYFKQGTMLYNLQYVLGEELFLKAMKNYFQQWKFAHPYPEDFRNSIIQYTKVDLNWFFDQWLETTKYIDYGIKNVNKIKNTNEYEITFIRKGSMQMPLDFSVLTENGDSLHFHIPNTWFEKNTNATILPKWYGWGLLQSEYTVKITSESDINNVIIDPKHLMADIDLRDNYWKNFTKIKFDTRKPSFSQWNNRVVKIGPALSYDKFNGAQIGIQSNTNYFGKNDFVKTAIFFNTGLFQNNISEVTKNHFTLFSLKGSIRKNLNMVWRELSLNEDFVFNNGLLRFKAGFSKIFRERDARNPNFTRVSIYYKSITNSTNFSHNNYFLYQNQWSEGLKTIPNSRLWEEDRTNSSLNIEVEKFKETTFGERVTSLSLRTPGVLSSFNYSYATFKNEENMYFGNFELRSRLFARIGSQNTPLESSLYLAGANQEELLDVQNIELAHIMPASWFGYGTSSNIFQQGGGLNLRGYAGYLAPENVNNNAENAYYGNTGASLSLELDFDDFFTAKRQNKYFHLDAYLFGDLGRIYFINSLGNEQKGSLRADAGIGSVLTLKFPNRTIQPISVRFDVPFYVSHVQPSQQNIDFGRYIIGIGRTF